MVETIKRREVEMEDVREFQKKFGHLNHDTPTHLTRRKLKERFDFMLEELNEFAEAVATQDMASIADALVDLVYVAKGTAVMLGLPWPELWAEVQRANMEKERGIGPRGHLVDCIKPAGWTPPKIHKVLSDGGYSLQSHIIDPIYIDDPEYTQKEICPKCTDTYQCSSCSIKEEL